MIEYFKEYENIKFVRVKNKTKSPYELNWQNNPISYDDILKHIETGQNYGVLGGYGGLIIIDADKVTSSTSKDDRFPQYDQELPTIIEELLPKTLKVRSGSGAYHYYFFCPKLQKKVVLKSKREGKELHWGEIMSYGSQVIGPGSIHPITGKTYEIINNTPIAEISPFKLHQALSGFLTTVQDTIDNSHTNNNIDNLRVEDIFNTSSLKSNTKNQLYGSHPVHGSSSGMNFWIDTSKNVWHCFRCSSGGGAAAAIGVVNGIIDCSEAKRGQFNGEKFKKVIELAKKQYNLISKPEIEVQNFQEIKDNEDNKKLLNLWTFKDFEKFEYDNNYLVERILYPQTVTMLYSPPGDFKSIMSVYMALAIAQGEKWCGYDTQQNAVLYCDKENNDKIIKERLMAMYKGLEYKDKEMPLYFLRREGNLMSSKGLDNNFISKLFYTIQTYNIKVVFFDTMHRFGDYDENSSDDINTLYTYIFQPLIEQFGCSIVFLHHTNKDGNFRGSGDFLGMVDTAYSFKREKQQGTGTKKNIVKIINEKNRSGEVEIMKAELFFENVRDENDNLILDSLFIDKLDSQDENKDSTKFSKCASICRNHLQAGKKLYKRDFDAVLKNNGLDISQRTLINVLNWLIEKEEFIREKDNGYVRNCNNFNFNLEDIEEVL